MQLSVWKHYVQLTLKYIHLKYIISVISTVFENYVKVYFFFTN